jgi:hypothetical protein
MIQIFSVQGAEGPTTNNLSLALPLLSQETRARIGPLRPRGGLTQRRLTDCLMVGEILQGREGEAVFLRHCYAHLHEPHL